MKNIFIALLLVSGTGLVYAQESKIAEEKQEIPAQIKIEVKEDTKYQDEDKNKLPSEMGLKKETANKQPSAPKGNLIQGTSDIEKIKASIPGRKQNQASPVAAKKSVNGLRSPATLEEIKKTIPKK